jgi:hypothetical protein
MHLSSNSCAETDGWGNAASTGMFSKLPEWVKEVAVGILALAFVSWAGMQSWGGETPSERRWQRRQAIMKWIGIPAACVSAGCQLAVVLSVN